MERCFLNSVFTDGENKVYEVVKFSNKPLETVVEYYDEIGLRNLYEGGGYTFDFSIRDGFLVWLTEGPEVRETTARLNEMLKREREVFTNTIKTVYDLIVDLIELGAIYLDYTVEPDGTDPLLGDISPEGNGIAKFSELNVSKSTMNMFFRVMSDEGFRTRSLIEMNEGDLQFTEFCFAIDKGKERLVSEDYPLTHLGDGNLFGREVAVFKLQTGMSIYPIMSPYFKLFEPVLNWKIYESEKNKVAIDLLTYFINATLNALYPEQEESARESERPEYITNENRKWGVNFKLKSKMPTMIEREKMLGHVIELFPEMVKSSMSLQDLLGHLKRRGYDAARQYACLVLLRSLSTANTSQLDMVEGAKSIKAELKLNKLRQDIELFSIRSFVYMSDYKLPYGADTYEIAGGNSPYIAVITKKIKR